MAESLTPTPWVTPEQAKAVTGFTVSATDIATAQGIIGLKTGFLDDVTPLQTIGIRDQSVLRRAVAYESVFVRDNPDLFAGKDVSSAGQDGQSATFKADAHTLSPLAKMAIRSLSWKGSRSTTQQARTRVGVEEDDLLNWTPLV